MICALVPGEIALVHKAPFLFQTRGTKKDEAYLIGILSSIPFDWLSRRFVELAMTFELLNTFPIPRVDQATGCTISVDGHLLPFVRDLRPLSNRVTEISGVIAASDQRYVQWAQEVGVQFGTVKSLEEKDSLIAELDALVSILYGLSREQVEQVFATFHRGWDYKPRLAAVLTHFDRWTDLLKEGS